MFAADGTASALSLAPVVTAVLAIGGLLAFTRRHRRVGTVMASSCVLLVGASFLL